MIDGKDFFEEFPFMLRPKKAIKASEEGLCGICGQKIEGRRYNDTVFIRHTWGPPSMSLESSGYRKPVFICGECRLKELESNLRQAEGSVTQAKKRLDEYRLSTGSTNNE